jgi:hypothetical protein
MLDDFTHRTREIFEINRGRWFKFNIIILSFESSNATIMCHTVFTFVTQYLCTCVLVIFFIYLEKLRVQEAQY